MTRVLTFPATHVPATCAARRPRRSTKSATTQPPATKPQYGRGVWIAPYMGPNGETILVALNRSNRRVGEVIVPVDGNQIAAGDQLWRRLEAVDPDVPPLRVER